MILVDRLVWDEWNIAHIGGHSVNKGEVEEACKSDYLALETHNFRIMLIGKTATGRQLTVILALKSEGVYYPVTARTANRKERQYYQKVKGGEQAA